MSDWTFGDVKARNMEIIALCEQSGCGHLFKFDLDQLIARNRGRIGSFVPDGPAPRT